jgi:hypothetical protein
VRLGGASRAVDLLHPIEHGQDVSHYMHYMHYIRRDEAMTPTEEPLDGFRDVGWHMKELTEYNRVLDLLHDERALNAELLAALKECAEHWSPLYRTPEMEDEQLGLVKALIARAEKEGGK